MKKAVLVLKLPLFPLFKLIPFANSLVLLFFSTWRALSLAVFIVDILPKRHYKMCLGIFMRGDIMFIPSWVTLAIISSSTPSINRLSSRLSNLSLCVYYGDWVWSDSIKSIQLLTRMTISCFEWLFFSKSSHKVKRNTFLSYFLYICQYGQGDLFLSRNCNANTYGSHCDLWLHNLRKHFVLRLSLEPGYIC